MPQPLVLIYLIKLLSQTKNLQHLRKNNNLAPTKTRSHIQNIGIIIKSLVLNSLENQAIKTKTGK